VASQHTIHMSHRVVRCVAFEVNIGGHARVLVGVDVCVCVCVCVCV
jgi:hypothetical protein